MTTLESHTNSNTVQTASEPLPDRDSDNLEGGGLINPHWFCGGLPSGLFPSYRPAPTYDEDGNPEIARTPTGEKVRAKKEPLFKCKTDESIHLPLVMDTEFTTLAKSKLQVTPRTHISSQVRHIREPVGSLWFHPDVADECNDARTQHGMQPAPILKTEFDAFDWLTSKGFGVLSWQGDGQEYKNHPTMVVTVYAHFALAELNLIFRGSLKKTIKQLQRKGKITQQRRLMARGDTPYQDYVQTGHIVKLTHSDPEYREYHGQTYKLAIRFIDTGGIHGVAGYDAIAKNVGHELTHKDNFSKEDKARMLDMAIERPQDFEDYALGDLDVYEILVKYDELMKEIYEQLGIIDYYRQPQLTIGGTVKNLFEAKLAQRIGIKPEDDDGENSDWYSEFKEFSTKYFEPVSPQQLSSYVNQTKALLAKVQGGRCRNAKQLVAQVNELICDIDISGCYGEGQRNQVYPIGQPLIWTFKADSKNNHYPSLYEWLKWQGVKWSKRKGVTDWGELINGGWFARVSTFEPLKYPQDLIESWTSPNRDYKENLLAKFVRQSGNDSENQDSELVNFDTEYGCLKMLHYEIKNGILTHDLLQVILTAHPRQLTDLLKKIRVTASMVYPKSQLIDCGSTVESLKTLEAKLEGWKNKNTTQQLYDNQGKPYLVTIERECYGWVGVNLGDLLIDDLLINRTKAKITDGKKSPKDQLFKLCVNTTYGDLVSRFFVTSNPCVGNNITARARALAWCMERGFDSFQSITDGGCFQLNKVNHKPSFNPRGKKAIAPLGGEGEIIAKWEDGKVSIYKSNNLMTQQWVDVEAWNHLAQCFPTLDLFTTPTTRLTVDKDTLEVTREPRQGMFEFEVKDYYESGVFHGSANYRLVNPNGVTLRARGYESSRKHDGWLWGDDELLLSERYGKSTPIGDLLKAIATDPTRVPRQEVAVKGGILKVKDYAKHCGKYDEMGLEPGDNLLKPLLVSEFSISQFTFKTWEQWNTWEKAIGRAKNKGKQSIEGFFLNNDRTLNYQTMITWVHQAIENDVLDPFKELDEHRNRQRKRIMTHPQADTLYRVREQLEQPFVWSEENAENARNWETQCEAPELDGGSESGKARITREKHRFASKKTSETETQEVVAIESVPNVTSRKKYRFGSKKTTETETQEVVAIESIPNVTSRKKYRFSRNHSDCLASK